MCVFKCVSVCMRVRVLCVCMHARCVHARCVHACVSA